MASVNKVILVGHLGKDTEVRYLDNNVSVCSFPFATSETYAKGGVRGKHTEWHNIVMWRNLAAMAVKYLQKGKLAYIEGRLRTRKYEDKEGTRRYVTESVGESSRALGRHSESGPTGKMTAPDEEKNDEKEEEVDFTENNDDTDGLPF